MTVIIACLSLNLGKDTPIATGAEVPCLMLDTISAEEVGCGISFGGGGRGLGGLNVCHIGLVYRMAVPCRHVRHDSGGIAVDLVLPNLKPNRLP